MMLAGLRTVEVRDELFGGATYDKLRHSMICATSAATENSLH